MLQKPKKNGITAFIWGSAFISGKRAMVPFVNGILVIILPLGGIFLYF